MRVPLALALLACGACQEPLTEVVLRVDSDLQPGREVESVRVVVRREGSTSVSYDVLHDLRSGRLSFPGTVGLVPRDLDDPRRLVVEVVPLRGGRPLFTHQASALPRAREVRVLEVFLARRCLEVEAQRCPAGGTCGRDGCEPVSRELVPWDGGS